MFTHKTKRTKLKNAYRIYLINQNLFWYQLVTFEKRTSKMGLN